MSIFHLTSIDAYVRRMMEKLKDEYEAMIICREKAAQRGLPMQVIDAEYQWCVQSVQLLRR